MKSMEQARDSVFLEDRPTDGDPRGRGDTYLIASLRVAGIRNVLSVRVRNISAGGLMAELPEPVFPDSAVEVELRGIGWVTGRVAWQTEGRAGIAFDRPIDPQGTGTLAS